MLLIRLLWYYHDRADLGSTVQEQEILSYSSIGKLSFSIDSMDWKLKATELFWRSVIVTTGQVTKISGLTLKTIKAYHTNIIGVHQVDEGLSWSFIVTKKLVIETDKLRLGNLIKGSYKNENYEKELQGLPG